ncbi:MAG: hypothetical protein MRECE_7c001, partial [Mycoplasmataceae bacterium CE_OT135]
FYFEYRRSKAQSGKKLGELEKMLIKEIVARKDLEKKMVEDELKQTRWFCSHYEKDSEKHKKEVQRLDNIITKLRFKLSRNGIKAEEIDLDDTPWDEWEKDWEKKNKK